MKIRNYLLANIGSFIINIAVQFISVTVIVSHNGLSGLGVWIICSTGVSYLMLSTLGTTETLATYISNNHSKLFNDKALGFYNSLKKLQWIILLIFSLFFIFINFNYDLLGLNSNIKYTNYFEYLSYEFLLIVIVANAAVLQAFARLSIVARFCGLYDVHVWFSSILKLVELTILIFFLHFNLKFDIILIYYLFFRICFYYILLNLFNNKTDFFEKNTEKIHFKNLTVLIHGSIAANLVQLTNLITNPILNNYVFTLYGEETLGLVTVFRTYSRTLIKITSVFLNTLIPIYSLKPNDIIFTLLNKNYQIICIVLGVILAFIAYLIAPFILKKWVGEFIINSNDYTLIAPIIIESLLVSISLLFNYKRTAQNRHLTYNLLNLSLLVLGSFVCYFSKINLYLIFIFIGMAAIFSSFLNLLHEY